MAKQQRRRGTETSATRARLLDVTEQIMVRDGYAAVSSRRIAAEAGVTAALVHYYFGTLDDLFLAVLRRGADQQLERLEHALSETDRPLRMLWDLARDPSRTQLVLEFAALANHRKAVQSEMASVAERFRDLQRRVLEDRLAALAIDDVPPIAVLVLLNAVGQIFVLERSLGLDLGHAETAAVVERYLDELE